MTNSKRIPVTHAQANAISYYHSAIQDVSIGKLLYASVAINNAGLSESKVTEAIAMGYEVMTEGDDLI